MARRLHRFSVAPQEGGFRLHIEDDDGQAIEIEASREQIELITDELDDLLAGSEAEEGDA
jgi:hypothetical protein